jgi:hypothetical protein
MSSRAKPLDVAHLKTLQSHVSAHGVRATARQCGIHHAAIQRALRGASISANTHLALGKIAPRVRRREEFAGASGGRTAPRSRGQQLSWELGQIKASRDMQLLGKFSSPVRLAKAMRFDDALFTAFESRMAPHKALTPQLRAESSSRGESVARRAASSVFVPKSELLSIAATLVNHGLAVGQVLKESNESGTLVDFRLREWPLEHVEWDPSRRVLLTSVEGGFERIPVTHGDGDWIVFRNFATEPWTHAPLLSAALVWAAHAGNLAAWMGSTDAHGRSRMIGSLPEGVALEDADGNLTPEAESFARIMNDLAEGMVAAGVIPPGASAEFIANGSSAWQVFETLSTGREKAAMRIYTGTDAALGSVGGAPGIDITALFGVATTIVQGDLDAIARGLNSGLLEPWAAINEGTSRYAPQYEYDYPDPDAETHRAQARANRERLHTTLREMTDLGFEINQELVATLAREFGVSPVPMLAATQDVQVKLDLAPTDVARVTRVNEARVSQRLVPLADERGNLFVSELEAYSEAKNTPTAIDPSSGEPSA